MKRMNLIKAREQLDYKQVQIAKVLGISKQHYSRLENGQQIGSVEVWDSIENFFGIPQQILRSTESEDIIPNAEAD